MIPEKLTAEALAEQVIEECGELVQALAKQLRILRGENPTPVSDRENSIKVIEEMADVSLCIEVLSNKLDCGNQIEVLMGKKRKRWEKRLNG